MRSATRLSVSWDRSHAHRHLSLVVDAPRAADSGAQRHGGNDVRAPAPRLLLDGDHGPDLAAGGPARPAVGHVLGLGGVFCQLPVPYMAAVIDLCTRMAVGLAFPGRMTADLPIAALGPSRGRGCVALGAISRSDRSSQHAPEAMADWAHGARREAARRRDGTPPRQRRRRVIPRHVQERDVPPSQLRHPQGGATRISRVRRGIPRPPSPALHDRLPHPRRGDGRTLRAHGRDGRERGGVATGGMIMGRSLSGGG